MTLRPLGPLPPPSPTPLQNGLVIRPFRKAHLTRGTDRELLYLSAYLAKIAELDSLAGLNHKHWESHARAEIRLLRKQADALAAAVERHAGGGSAASPEAR